MGIIKSKAEKKQEQRIAVKRSLRDMEKRITYLEAQEAKYVEDAKIALREGLPKQFELTKHALKMTVSERKRTYQMLLNARVISQMKDMSEMTAEFLKAVQILSKEIASAADVNTSKLQRDLNTAMSKLSHQTEQLEDVLECSQDEIELSADSTADLVSDSDIDKLIYGASAGNVDIDKEIAEIKNIIKD